LATGGWRRCGTAKQRYKEFSKKYGRLGAFFLHAAQLQFTHPKTGAHLKFESPLPDELTSLLERIRG